MTFHGMSVDSGIAECFQAPGGFALGWNRTAFLRESHVNATNGVDHHSHRIPKKRDFFVFGWDRTGFVRESLRTQPMASITARTEFQAVGLVYFVMGSHGIFP